MRWNRALNNFLPHLIGLEIVLNAALVATTLSTLTQTGPDRAPRQNQALTAIEQRQCDRFDLVNSLPAAVSAAPRQVATKPLLGFINSKPRRVAPFPILLSKAVRHYIDKMADSPRGLREAINLYHPYLHEMVQILKREGVPSDFIYLAFAESRFCNRCGQGPWQLNKATAQEYGLRVDRWVDERLDPILSTEAAALYLAHLHDRAKNDWRLAVVGWNIGQNHIPSYLRLKGSNFARYESSLPTRTRQLLVRFMAADFVAQNAKNYGLAPITFAAAPAYKIEKVRGGTSISEIAWAHGTTVKKIRALNPAVLGDRVPPGPEFYRVRVPANRIGVTGVSSPETAGVSRES